MFLLFFLLNRVRKKKTRTKKIRKNNFAVWLALRADWTKQILALTKQERAKQAKWKKEQNWNNIMLQPAGNIFSIHIFG